MDEEPSNTPKQGWLKRTFKGAVGVLKELTVHSIIHFTLWGAIFASNFAAFLAPVFDPLGAGVTFLAKGVGLEHLFTEAAGSGGALTVADNPEISSVPELEL